MLYGIEIWELNNVDFSKVETAHRQMARNHQGLSGFTAGPAVLATLGRVSLSAWVDRRRLIFLYGLFNLPNDNLYRMITVNRIIHLCSKTNLVAPKGTICVMNVYIILWLDEWKKMVSLKVMSAKKEHWYINKIYRVHWNYIGGCVWNLALYLVASG